MKADAVPVLAIFEKKLRLEVPLFQRQYVWGLERHWEPLWEDIARKFTDHMGGRSDGPVHFLGAMVLDQKQTPATHVEKRQIIDGQQRLTTLLIFLSTLRDFCRDQGCEELADECEGFTLNKGMMAAPHEDKYKVWPTQLDRPCFIDVVSSGSCSELEKRYPLTRRPRARKPDPRPRMIEAYLFFYGRLREFFLGAESDPPAASHLPLASRLETCFYTLKSALQVVEIDLEPGDDAQVIFETLNSRGEPLLPMDLLRNYIFLRAARQREEPEALYRDYWKQFDEGFWRQEVKQGRLVRPRSDLFMQHFLASRQAVEIPIKYLFAEYKHWIEHAAPFSTVTDELSTLARQGRQFRRILEPSKNDPLYSLAVLLDEFDVRTPYPLLLAMLDSGVGESDWRAMTRALESYILRRAICGWTTKNYNRVSLALTRAFCRDGATVLKLIDQLTGLSGESAAWPSDAAFSDAWRTRHAYQALNNPKIVFILKRINETYVDSKMESVSVDGPLTVEHILPQYWTANWPLPDGSKGLAQHELYLASPQDPRTVATRERERALQTFGNLTVLSRALNSAQSNSAWVAKKPELMRHSLLPINQMLYDVEVWDEQAIAGRGEQLLERALRLWPRDSGFFESA